MMGGRGGKGIMGGNILGDEIILLAPTAGLPKFCEA